MALNKNILFDETGSAFLSGEDFIFLQPCERISGNLSPAAIFLVLWSLPPCVSKGGSFKKEH